MKKSVPVSVYPEDTEIHGLINATIRRPSRSDSISPPNVHSTRRRSLSGLPTGRPSPSETQVISKDCQRSVSVSRRRSVSLLVNVDVLKSRRPSKLIPLSSKSSESSHGTPITSSNQTTESCSGDTDGESTDDAVPTFGRSTSLFCNQQQRQEVNRVGFTSPQVLRSASYDCKLTSSLRTSPHSFSMQGKNKANIFGGADYSGLKKKKSFNEVLATRDAVAVGLYRHRSVLNPSLIPTDSFGLLPKAKGRLSNLENKLSSRYVFPHLSASLSDCGSKLAAEMGIPLFSDSSRDAVNQKVLFSEPSKTTVSASAVPILPTSPRLSKIKCLSDMKIAFNKSLKFIKTDLSTIKPKLLNKSLEFCNFLLGLIDSTSKMTDIQILENININSAISSVQILLNDIINELETNYDPVLTDLKRVVVMFFYEVRRLSIKRELLLSITFTERRRGNGALTEEFRSVVSDTLTANILEEKQINNVDNMARDVNTESINDSIILVTPHFLHRSYSFSDFGLLDNNRNELGFSKSMYWECIQKLAVTTKLFLIHELSHHAEVAIVLEPSAMEVEPLIRCALCPLYEQSLKILKQCGILPLSYQFLKDYPPPVVEIFMLQFVAKNNFIGDISNSSAEESEYESRFLTNRYAVSSETTANDSVGSPHEVLLRKKSSQEVLNKLNKNYLANPKLNELFPKSLPSSISSPSPFNFYVESSAVIMQTKSSIAPNISCRICEISISVLKVSQHLSKCLSSLYSEINRKLAAIDLEFQSILRHCDYLLTDAHCNSVHEGDIQALKLLIENYSTVEAANDEQGTHMLLYRIISQLRPYVNNSKLVNNTTSITSANIRILALKIESLIASKSELTYTKATMSSQEFVMNHCSSISGAHSSCSPSPRPIPLRRGVSNEGMSLRASIAIKNIQRSKSSMANDECVGKDDDNIINPVSISDFEFIKPISRGAYGAVFLAKKKSTGDFFAIKMVKKGNHLRKRDFVQLRLERDSMARSCEKHVVQLFFAFQTSKYLFFVMEYIPGGDLRALIAALGSFDEDLARQYIAEILVALEHIHSIGRIHRDLKPDNVLIGRDGHIKLTDFGLAEDCIVENVLDTAFRNEAVDKLIEDVDDIFFCSSSCGDELISRSLSFLALSPRIESKYISPTVGSISRIYSFINSPLCVMKDDITPRPTGPSESLSQYSSGSATDKGSIVSEVSCFGTPDYLAPELLLGSHHCETVDYWALGVMLFEFITGLPPFNDDTAELTFGHIIARQLWWPEPNFISPDAVDLIEKLLTIDPSQRLGAGGALEIKSHPFFRNIDWSNVLSSSCFFVPKPSHDLDTSYFEPRGVETVESVICDELTGANTSSLMGFNFKNIGALADLTRKIAHNTRKDCITLLSRDASFMLESPNRSDSDITLNYSPLSFASPLSACPSSILLQ